MSKAKTPKTIAREIERSFKQRKQQIEESMKNLDPGSRAYLDRLIALANLERKYREERAERGLDPQNLGAVVQVVYDFRATTSLQPDTRTAERKLWEAGLDREFGMASDPDYEDGVSSTPNKPRRGRKVAK